jgi:hypothetical protein
VNVGLETFTACKVPIRAEEILGTNCVGLIAMELHVELGEYLAIGFAALWVTPM